MIMKNLVLGIKATKSRPALYIKAEDALKLTDYIENNPYFLLSTDATVKKVKKGSDCIHSFASLYNRVKKLTRK